MMDRRRLPLRFDPQRLEEDLARIDHLEWTEHFVKQNYDGSWSVIPLRAPVGETHLIRMIYADPTCRAFTDTPFLLACPYFQEVLATFDAPLAAVRLMKLAAGSVIKEHSDYNLTPEQGTIRLHIPVVTNPGVEFHLNRRPVVMKPGECWYLRLSDPHAVANHGATDRVHLVIDVEVNGWVENLLAGETTSEDKTPPLSPCDGSANAR